MPTIASRRVQGPVRAQRGVGARLRRRNGDPSDRRAIRLLLLLGLAVLVLLTALVAVDLDESRDSPPTGFRNGPVQVSPLVVAHDDGGRTSFSWTITTDRAVTFARMQLATEGQPGAGFHPGVTVDGTRTFSATQAFAPGNYTTTVVYSLDGVEWVAASSATHVSTGATADADDGADSAVFQSSPDPQPLPEKVVGGYWTKWADSPSSRLREVDPRYNTVLLAFAQGTDGDGSVRFDQDVQSQESFVRDVHELRNRGTRVVLSIGGQDGRVDLAGPERGQEFVDSVVALREQFPFDGLDWDIEGQELDIPTMRDVSLQLRARFGSDFAVMMAPGGHVVEYKQLAQELGNDLDFIGIQYYDYATASQQERIDDVKESTAELIEVYGLRPSQIGIGMRVFDEQSEYTSDGEDTEWFTVEGSREAWRQLEALYPDLRGAYQWELGTDSRLGGRWISEVGATIGGS